MNQDVHGEQNTVWYWENIAPRSKRDDKQSTPTLNSFSRNEWLFIYPWTPGDRNHALSTEFGKVSEEVKLWKRQELRL